MIVCAFVVVFVRRVCLRSPCRRHFPTPGAALLFPILGMHPQRMRGVGTVGEWQLLFVLFVFFLSFVVFFLSFMRNHGGWPSRASHGGSEKFKSAFPELQALEKQN